MAAGAWGWIRNPPLRAVSAAEMDKRRFAYAEERHEYDGEDAEVEPAHEVAHPVCNAEVILGSCREVPLTCEDDLNRSDA